MDTKVGQIIGIYKPREAENADTRYGLFGQGSLGYGGQERQGHSQDSFEDDQATVSTEALLLFLESLLIRQYGLSAEEAADSYIPQASSQRPAANVESLRLKAAEAVKAYSHAAHVSRKVARKNQKLNQPEAVQDGTADLQNVLRLIRDLRTLSSHKVDRLHVERGDSFIDSLAAAVLKAKQDLPV